MSDLTHADSLKQQLEALLQVRLSMKRPRPAGYAYHGMEDFILQRGVLFESQPLTLDELKVVRAAAKGQTFFLKACFQNAQALVKKDRSGRLTYVEGFANGNIGLAVHHAWAVLDGTKVIDPTWLADDTPKDLHELSRPHSIEYGVLSEYETRAYYGVTFPNRTRLKLGLKKATGLSLLDDWERNWPLLREGAYEDFLKETG